MQLTTAARMARELMNEHGLTDWSLKMDMAKRRFGYCNYRRKTISLSVPLIQLNGEDEVRDTVLHEIAHALAPGKGHGFMWREKCREIGARPQRCYSSESVAEPAAPWVGTAATCGHTLKRFRMSRNSVSCGKCSGGRYNENYKVTWKRV